MNVRGLPLLAIVATTTSCIWLGAVHETRPAPSSTVPRTPLPGQGDPAGDAVPNPGQAAPSMADAPLSPRQPTDAAALPRPAYTVPAVTAVPMLGMLILATEAPPPGNVATVRVSLPAGRGSALGGLAELTAEIVAELSLPSMPGGSLRRALELQGASLTVEVDAETTAFEVILPPANLRAVLALLGERLAWRIDPDTTVPAVDRIRQVLARRLASARVRDPLTAMLTRSAGDRDAAQALTELNLRTAPEVALFQRARYRATGALLASWVPGVSTADQVLAVRDGFLPWLDPTATTFKALPLAPTVAAQDVRWVDTADEPTLALALTLPGPSHPLAAELMVLRECFSHDGVGGRLGIAATALAGRGIAFASTRAPHDSIVLRARATADLALPLWDIAKKAQASVHAQPPGTSELTVAAGRARLRLLAECADPSAWLRRVTDIVHHQGTLAGITACLTRLESPERLRLPEALPVFAALPLALGVVGRTPSKGLPPSVQMEPEIALLPDSVERILLPDEAAERERAATPFVERALAALGGKAALASVRGYRTVTTSDAGEGPTLETTTELLANGNLRETRKILATTVETVITKDAGVERAGKESVTLPIDEVRLRQSAAARHPLLLMAKASRGELRLRLVSLRMAGDREHAVLEVADDKSVRLRLSIDTGSGLIRAIEMREWHAVGGLQTVVDEYEDYRTITGGRRVPFFRRRSLGDDRAPLLTTTTTFEVR